MKKNRKEIDPLTISLVALHLVAVKCPTVNAVELLWSHYPRSWYPTWKETRLAKIPKPSGFARICQVIFFLQVKLSRKHQYHHDMISPHPFTTQITSRMTRREPNVLPAKDPLLNAPAKSRTHSKINRKETNPTIQHLDIFLALWVLLSNHTVLDCDSQTAL